MITIDDIKNSITDEELIKNANEYLAHTYKDSSYYKDAKIIHKYDDVLKFCAYVNKCSIYRKVYNKKTLKDAVIEAIIEFNKEIDSCRSFNDDIDSDFD